MSQCGTTVERQSLCACEIAGARVARVAGQSRGGRCSHGHRACPVGVRAGHGGGSGAANTAPAGGRGFAFSDPPFAGAVFATAPAPFCRTPWAADHPVRGISSVTVLADAPAPSRLWNDGRTTVLVRK